MFAIHYFDKAHVLRRQGTEAGGNLSRLGLRTIKQFGGFHFKTSCQSNYCLKARVAFSPFDAANVGSIKIDQMRKPFLRIPSLGSQAAQVLAEGMHIERILHTRTTNKKTLDRLRTNRIISLEREVSVRIFTIIGFKGGIGRTTAAAALSFGLASKGARVAILDAGHSVELDDAGKSKFTGIGSAPETTELQKWVDDIDQNAKDFGSLQYLRAKSGPYLRASVRQLEYEGFDYLVIDTPAHQSTGVFEAVERSAALIAPVRNLSVAKAVKDSLANEFIPILGRTSFLLLGERNPADFNQALEGCSFLSSVLPCHFRDDDENWEPVPLSNGSVIDLEWQAACISLAYEVAKITDQGADNDQTRPVLGVCL